MRSECYVDKMFTIRRMPENDKIRIHVISVRYRYGGCHIKAFEPLLSRSSCFYPIYPPFTLAFSH